MTEEIINKTFGDKIADWITSYIGSWLFVFIQSMVLILWIFMNARNIVEYDPYPFILLNLVLSFQAAYYGPIIMISQNRQMSFDRKTTNNDLTVDIDTNKAIKALFVLIEEMSTKIDNLSSQKQG